MASWTPAEAEALCRKAIRALDAQRPAMRAIYERAILAGEVRVLPLAGLRGLLLCVTDRDTPLCDATWEELRRDAEANN